MPDAIVPKETQQKWLLEICEKLVEKYILPSTENFLCIVEQAQELQEGCNVTYMCRYDACSQTFAFHSGRVR